MENIFFMKGYQHHEKLRKSFNELAGKTFGLNFEKWYEHGYWTDKYEPFSFIEEKKVIANVSVNKLNLQISGQKLEALQIGTVMTHPDYRNRGLSRKLMEKVLEEYDRKVELMYLFANGSVLDFYPKFGFDSREEHQFSWDISGLEKKKGKQRKLDANSLNDLNFIYRFAEHRQEGARLFSVENTKELLMFYCLYVFRDHIYFLEEEDAIVLYQLKKDVMHLFDVVSSNEVTIERIVSKIAAPESTKVIFYYTPAYSGIQTEMHPFFDDTTLFIRNRTNIQLPKHFKHPLTSKA